MPSHGRRAMGALTGLASGGAGLGAFAFVACLLYFAWRGEAGINGGGIAVMLALMLGIAGFVVGGTVGAIVGGVLTPPIPPRRRLTKAEWEARRSLRAERERAPRQAVPSAPSR